MIMFLINFWLSWALSGVVDKNEHDSAAHESLSAASALFITF
jgi:hypothetical protein